MRGGARDGLRLARRAAVRGAAYAALLLGLLALANRVPAPPGVSIRSEVGLVIAAAFTCLLVHWTVDGRPLHSAARSWLRMRSRRGRLAAFRPRAAKERRSR